MICTLGVHRSGGLHPQHGVVLAATSVFGHSV